MVLTLSTVQCIWNVTLVWFIDVPESRKKYISILSFGVLDVSYPCIILYLYPLLIFKHKCNLNRMNKNKLTFTWNRPRNSELVKFWVKFLVIRNWWNYKSNVILNNSILPPIGILTILVFFQICTLIGAVHYQISIARNVLKYCNVLKRKYKYAE